MHREKQFIGGKYTDKLYFINKNLVTIKALKRYQQTEVEWTHNGYNEVTVRDMLLNKMVVNFNMFGMLMKSRICGNVNSGNIVTQNPDSLRVVYFGDK